MFTNIRKSITVMILLAIFILSVLISVSFSVDNAYAETQEYYSAEYYTDSDYLLNADGTTDENRKIKDFALDVQNSSFVDLGSVIPLQYLESQEENAVFYYMGKEYGFYVSKEKNIFDVLLIDFVYEFTDGIYSDLEYLIRIKPILQQSFKRSITNDGSYEFKKYDGYSYMYYIGNPRFLTVLHNENALNYGDEQYSKYDDDGLIINQFRVNYGKVSYATESDLGNIASDLVVNQVCTLGMSVVDAFTFGIVGSIVDYVLNFAEFGVNISDVSKENVITVGNEENIATNMSKSSQREDASLPTYSRTVGFLPKEEIILSDANDSYAELIAVLNDSNFRSRLTQFCEFDIYKRDSQFSSMEQVTDESGRPKMLRFSFERKLFDEQAPHFTMDGYEFEESPVPVYLLPNGKQQFSFIPKHSGEYRFAYPASAELSLNGDVNNAFYLNANQEYVFNLENNTNDRIIGHITGSLPQLNMSEPVTIKKDTSLILKYYPRDNGYKYLQFDGSLTTELLDKRFNKIAESENGNLFYNFDKNQYYYLCIHHSGNSDISTRITDNDIESLSVGNKSVVLPDYKVANFTNPFNVPVEFQLEIVWDGGYKSASVYNQENRSIGVAVSSPNKQVISFALNSNEKCFVIFSNADGSITANVSVNEQNLRWKVGNDIINGQSIRLERNKTYDIKLVLMTDGEEAEQISSFTHVARDEFFTLSNGRLQIKSAAVVEYDIILTPTIAPDFLLTITVTLNREEIDYTITFDKQGGSGGSDTVIAHYNYYLPVATSPTRTGYIFKGYFGEQNGEGIQYYTADMRNTELWKVESHTTLYAYWEVIVYNIYYNLNGGTNSSYNPQTYTIETPTINFYPATKTGYTCEWNIASIPKGSYGDKTITANWTIISYYVMVHFAIDETWMPVDGGSDSYSFRLNYGQEKTITAKSFKNLKFLFWRYYPSIISGQYHQSAYPILSYEREVVIKNLSEKGLGYDVVACYEEVPSSCISAGSLITLADGRQVPVETLTGNEMLLVWNLQTGTFDSAKILFIDKDPSRLYKVINLGFSDGTNVKVISEHAFWDFDLNKYVYLDENASSYIGHYFNKQITNADGSIGYGRVQLVSVDIRDEYTTAYSPVTYGHLCYYVNGMLSVPGGIAGLFNIFDVDAETMTVNAELMEQDVLRYGLFTYEEFAALAPISEEAFNAFNGQYLKVAIGKGLITADDLQILVARYAGFLEEI